MKVVCVWKEGYDYSRGVEDWLVEFERRTGYDVESVNPDTKGGEAFARAYDVVEYPTMMALSEDGAVLASWRGTQMPLFDEVAYWL